MHDSSCVICVCYTVTHEHWPVSKKFKTSSVTLNFWFLFMQRCKLSINTFTVGKGHTAANFTGRYNRTWFQYLWTAPHVLTALVRTACWELDVTHNSTRSSPGIYTCSKVCSTIHVFIRFKFFSVLFDYFLRFYLNIASYL